MMNGQTESGNRFFASTMETSEFITMITPESMKYADRQYVKEADFMTFKYDLKGESNAMSRLLW